MKLRFRRPLALLLTIVMVLGLLPTAALAADGVSEVDEICHIERGYEDIVEKLRGLGADIKRVEKPAGVLRQAAL